MAEAEAPSAAATEDVRALLECGVPLERLLALQPHGLGPGQLHEIAKDWVASAGSEHGPGHSLNVAGAVLARSKSALQNPAFTEKVLEGLEGDAPEDLKDPLFFTLLKDPVVLSSGIVLDRSSALNERGELRFRCCPFTREQLKREVYPLLFLKERLVDFVKTRLDQIFALVDTAMKSDSNDGSRDLATAKRALEVACSFLKDIGKHTYLGEAERVHRLRLQVLKAGGEAEPAPWRDAHEDLLRVLQLQGPEQRALEALEATAAEFTAGASACLKKQGQEASKSAVQAQGWLQAACELATRLGAEKPPAQAAHLKMPPAAVLGLARLLLEVARAAEAAGGELPEGAATVPQARTAVYLALQRSGAGDEEIGAFLQAEGLQQGTFAELLRAPTELLVRRKNDERSEDRWKEVGVLECGDGQVTSLAVSCRWKDQGWGNRKGRMGVVLRRGEEEIQNEDLFGVCGETNRGDFVLVQRSFAGTDPLLAQARPGDTLVFLYQVGGGGGHELFIRDFKADLGTVASNSEGSAAVAKPPTWMVPLVGMPQSREEVEITEVTYVDSDGDTVCFTYEDGQLIKSVNGRRQVAGRDTTGVVTRLHWRAGNRVDDQCGWGGRVPEEHLEALRALADRAGIEHNLPEVGGGSSSDGGSSDDGF